MIQLDTEHADRDLSATVTLLSYTMLADASVKGVVELGDGSKDLDGTGGDFELTLSINGVVYDGGVQTKTLPAGSTRARFQTIEFSAVTGDVILLRVKSPNAADDDVDTVATLWNMSPASEVNAALSASHGAGQWGCADGTGIGSDDSGAGTVPLIYKQTTAVTVECDVELPDPDVQPGTLVFETMDNEDVYWSSTDAAGDGADVVTTSLNEDDERIYFTFHPSAALVGTPGQELQWSYRVGDDDQVIVSGRARVRYKAWKNASSP